MMKPIANLLTGRCLRSTSSLVVCSFALVIGLGVPSTSWADEGDASQGNEAVLGLGSGLLTLVYLPAKVGYAALGGIVGGFTYGLTGGNLETAQSVWEPSFYGTYVITPDHLKGNEAVRFFGASPYEEEIYVTERVE